MTSPYLDRPIRDEATAMAAWQAYKAKARLLPVIDLDDERRLRAMERVMSGDDAGERPRHD